MQQKIIFNKERDFSALFGDSMLFLKQNFKSFFGAILLIAGPFLLISGVALGYMQSSIAQLQQMLSPNNFDYVSFFIMILVVILCSLMGIAVMYSVVFSYLTLYNNAEPGEQITVSDVGKKVLKNIWRLIGSFITFIIVMTVVSGCLALILYGISSLLGGIGIGILVVLGMLALIFIYGPVFGYIFHAAFFVVVRDEEFIFSAFRKVNKYLKGNFWWTWLIVVVASVGLYIVNLMFSLPATIYGMSGTLSRLNHMNDTSTNSLTLIILYTISMFFSHFTSSILLVICAYNFTSHEEKSEGAGLFSKIDEIK